MSLVVIVNVTSLDRYTVRQISAGKVAYFLSSGSLRRILFFIYLFRSMYLRQMSTGRSFTLGLNEDGRPWNWRVSAIGLRHLGLIPLSLSDSHSASTKL